MSSDYFGTVPRAFDVLPARVSRRLTRRDGLLPLVLALELMVGMAFGLAWQSGDSHPAAVPAQLRLAPVALVTVVPSPPPAPAVGPAVGPLLPGTVRPPDDTTAVVTVTRHAKRDPFGALVSATP